MFDTYQPLRPLHCPLDGQSLTEWQDKDGPCGLFVWREGVAHPVEQGVDDDIALLPADRERVRLPPVFAIYCYDCPVHQPIDAVCTTRDGVWGSTAVLPPLRARGPYPPVPFHRGDVVPVVGSDPPVLVRVLHVRDRHVHIEPVDDDPERIDLWVLPTALVAPGREPQENAPR